MVEEIKKIGHNICIKGMVIHQVNKKQGVRETKIITSKSLINTTENDQAFISKVSRAYYDKSSPIYGIFGNENTKFKRLLAEYISSSDFLSFTKKAIDEYKHQIMTSAPATGGFMIFSHYINTDKSHEYLLILSLNNKKGYVVNEKNLTIKSIKNLDLNKVDIACIIDLTKWVNIESGSDSESKTYLSFVRGNKDLSYYFMSFIDLSDKSTNAESTLNFLKALDSYQDKINLEREERINQRNAVFQYCEDCLDKKDEILLSRISTIINPNDPSSFERFASSEDFRVSAVIKGDRSKLKLIKYIIYKRNDFHITFDGNKLGKEYIFDNDKKELIIKNLPEDFVNQIKSHIYEAK